MTRDVAKRPGVAIEDGTSAVASRSRKTMSKFRSIPYAVLAGSLLVGGSAYAQSMYGIDQRQDYQQNRIEQRHPERPDHPERGLSPRGRASVAIDRAGPRPRRRRRDPAGAQPHRPHVDRQGQQIYRRSHDSQRPGIAARTGVAPTAAATAGTTGMPGRRNSGGWDAAAAARIAATTPTTVAASRQSLRLGSRQPQRLGRQSPAGRRAPRCAGTTAASTTARATVR